LRSRRAPIASRVDLSLRGADTVDLDLSGMGSATVYGKPGNCHSTTNGLGKVSWQ
jgi:hypothetical protein